MLIIGLNGSPNENGNTKLLLERVLKTAEENGAETEIINIQKALSTAKTPYCTACTNPCSGVCYKGTELEEAFELLEKADGVIFGSPVYFGTVSAQMKAFADKARGLRGKKTLYNKVGAAVTVGAAKFGGQETTVKALHDIMLVQGMLVLGDGFRDDDCGHHGVCSQKPSENDDFAIKRAQILGKRMVEVCKAVMDIR